MKSKRYKHCFDQSAYWLKNITTIILEIVNACHFNFLISKMGHILRFPPMHREDIFCHRLTLAKKTIMLAMIRVLMTMMMCKERQYFLTLAMTN